MSVLYVDKPKGITSFDVCYKLRKVLGTKRIGHTGTLDPNATGVMIVLSDKDCKANQFLVSDKKEYIATCILGYETDTLDIDGQVIRRQDCLMPEKDILDNCLQSFLGKSQQLPPMTSAIKVNGKKLYEYQRNNEEVEVKPREIEIYEIELLDVNANVFSFRCLVSSGTYIRTLLKDVLAKLDLVGTLKDLRRTKIDNISVDECTTLEDITGGKIIDHELYELLSYRYKTVDDYSNLKDIFNGKAIRLPLKDKEVLIADKRKCLAIYEKDGEVYRSKRGLF